MPAPGSSTNANVSRTSDSRISKDPPICRFFANDGFRVPDKNPVPDLRDRFRGDVPREEHHALAMFERPDGRLVQAHGLSAEHEDQDAEQSCDEVKLPHGFESRVILAEGSMRRHLAGIRLIRLWAKVLSARKLLIAAVVRGAPVVFD